VLEAAVAMGAAVSVAAAVPVAGALVADSAGSPVDVAEGAGPDAEGGGRQPAHTSTTTPNANPSALRIGQSYSMLVVLGRAKSRWPSFEAPTGRLALTRHNADQGRSYVSSTHGCRAG
jgi:hypothetical protein